MISFRQIAVLAMFVIPPTIVGAYAMDHAALGIVGWVALGLAAGVSIMFGVSVETRRRKRLGTIAAVLAAYREGDLAIRAKSSQGDALQDVLAELNLLGDSLRSHRLGEMEAWALLRKVMAEVDVVVLAVDDDGKIRLANDAATRVLGRPSHELVGESVGSLSLDELLTGSVPRIVKLATNTGPWELRRGAFRLEGVQQTLVVLSDVSRALRDNERDAWRRLIRVMGHEINNSLSPIKSISESLRGIADPTHRQDDWESDLRDGLNVIARRAESLERFMTSYAQLARLPPPRLAPTDLRSLVAKIAALETRTKVDVIGGPDLTIQADADQLEQVLINLVKNAAEATLESGEKGVRIRWETQDRTIALSVEDDGPGVSDTTNLFVPFFTTKPKGSGIGLALSRQIVEAHEGQLSLASREGGKGAVACIRLPKP